MQHLVMAKIALLSIIFFSAGSIALQTSSENKLQAGNKETVLKLTAEPSKNAVLLTGHFSQGGLIKGKANADLSGIKIGTVKVPLHNDKRTFVFGFGRDAKERDTLTVTFVDGSSIKKELSVNQRKYNIERVNGVAKKYVSPPKSVTERIKSESERVYLARQKMSFRTDFQAPVMKPAEGRFSGFYGSQRVFNGVPKRPHFGLDIAAPTGTDVLAPWSGQVVFADADLYYSGGTLIIDHGLGVTSTYIHLSKLDVVVGDKIIQGEKVGEIGATGRTTGPHLDWRINWFNRRLDPQLLLP